METNLKQRRPIMHYAILGLIFSTGILTLFGHTLLHAGHNHDEESATQIAATPCSTKGKTITIIVTDHGIDPKSTTAARCDILTIVNHRTSPSNPAFGAHEHHLEYPGLSDTPIAPGKSKTFQLVAAGNFPMHDHLDEGLTATLDVTH